MQSNVKSKHAAGENVWLESHWGHMSHGIASIETDALRRSILQTS